MLSRKKSVILGAGALMLFDAGIAYAPISDTGGVGAIETP